MFAKTTFILNVETDRMSRVGIFEDEYAMYIHIDDILTLGRCRALCEQLRALIRAELQTVGLSHHRCRRGGLRSIRRL